MREKNRFAENCFICYGINDLQQYSSVGMLWLSRVIKDSVITKNRYRFTG